MKNIKLRQKFRDILGVIAFLSLIVIGVVLTDARIGQLNEEQQKSATEVRTHIAQTK